jgi:YegS/Rv2252/BmrU family lipid kinase
VPAPVCLIVNPAAGGGRALRVAPAAEQALRARQLVVRRAQTRSLEHARELASEAAANGETIVTLGGDGLIGAVADALRHLPQAVLGAIPGGRGNDLARVLEIPDDTDGAAAIIAAGHTRRIDLGLVEPRDEASPHAARAFVGIASAGFDSDANRIANDAPPWLGGFVYVYGALRALAAWRPTLVEIELDPPGVRHTLSAFSIGACNSKAYGGGMRAAPGALLDDGLLDVVVLESVGKLAFLTRILPKVFKGTHVHEPGVQVFRARELTIATDRPFSMYADGDPVAELPVRVSALAGAVSMLVPAHAGEAFGAAHSPSAPAAETAPAPSPPSGADAQ